MKTLPTHTFNPKKARKECDAFKKLLASKTKLKEREDVLKNFKKWKDLTSLLMHVFVPRYNPVDRCAPEYPIGDFQTDWVVGSKVNRTYLLIEFEDGKPTSVFTHRNRNTPQWSFRFEVAYSQLVDWLWQLDELKSTVPFASVFGGSDATFYGLIVIGKDMKLSTQEEHRLKWRLAHHNKSVATISYDELFIACDEWLRIYFHV